MIIILYDVFKKIIRRSCFLGERGIWLAPGVSRSSVKEPKLMRVFAHHGEQAQLFLKSRQNKVIGETGLKGKGTQPLKPRNMLNN